MIPELWQAALLLALAVTLHNAEEMILLPDLTSPYMPKMQVGPLAFRFAATAIAVLFWLAALALLSGLPVGGILAGFSLAMIFNAVIPHLAVTARTRRYPSRNRDGLAVGRPRRTNLLGGFRRTWRVQGKSLCPGSARRPRGTGRSPAASSAGGQNP